MIRLKSLLLEVGELTPYPFQYFSELRKASFTTDNADYEVTFYGTPYSKKNDMQISFGADVGSGEYEEEITTNANDQYRIMSTITAIVKRAVAERKPNVIYFNASNEDPRRIALYMRYVTPLLHDYEIEKREPTAVTLRKKGWVTPKTPTKPKFDWTGIDTPGDSTM
jgi:hypothetical protein